MTSQYLNTLYHDLFSNSPQTVTLDIPAEMGTGQIAQVVTKLAVAKGSASKRVSPAFTGDMGRWSTSATPVSGIFSLKM